MCTASRLVSNFKSDTAVMLELTIGIAFCEVAMLYMELSLLAVSAGSTCLLVCMEFSFKLSV